MTKIVLNGREVEADPTKPLIHACHTEDVDVPMYCYHPGLTPVGSCRICQVEVKIGEMPPRTMVACRTPISEGMVVDTEAPNAHAARRECLEFLLKNHPLDCPICDKAGECDLQDYAFNEGQGEGRSVEPRRKLEKRKSLGDVIVLDEERCILCSRCVRFFEDVTDKPQLTVSGLAARSVISTFGDRPLEGNYQGNLADICPVGALTLKQFRFQARVWNLRKTPATCGQCSRGCAVSVEVLRKGDVKRVRPRYDADVNRWWMCDTGRFEHGRELEGAGPRLEGALSSADGPLDPADALDEAAALVRASDALTIVASPWLTNEEGARLATMAKSLGAEVFVVTPPPNDLADDLLHTGDPCPNRRGLEEAGLVAASADELGRRLAAVDGALLVGERVGTLLGDGVLGALPDALRVVALVTHALPREAADVQLGVPDCVERAGTWTNVDGIPRKIAIARPAPAGVAPLERTLDELGHRLASAEVAG